MNVPEQDATLECAFCEFTTPGGEPVYLDLFQVEGCIGTADGGSIVSMRSGADYMLSEQAMIVMSSVMMVSDNEAGRSLRGAQTMPGGFATLADVFKG